MFTNKDINDQDFVYSLSQSLRSILYFGGYYTSSGDYILNSFNSFALLRVLDLERCRFDDFPKVVELLVHLRYLVIHKKSGVFPSSICNLWRLQTLMYVANDVEVSIPSNISDLVNLRHLRCFITSINNCIHMVPLYIVSIEKPMINLQTITQVEFGGQVDSWQKCFPCIRELVCCARIDKENDFKSLTYLE